MLAGTARGTRRGLHVFRRVCHTPTVSARTFVLPSMPISRVWNGNFNQKLRKMYHMAAPTPSTVPLGARIAEAMRQNKTSTALLLVHDLM